MSLGNSSGIVTSGLIFSYDANSSRSWKGKPTTNYAYAQNARVDSSYTTYSATGSGTWNAKHPDAINVYNIDGNDITGYVNTGVGDWTNTYHAIWTYDYELQKPVVTMRDIDGQWKAKSFGLSTSTPAGMGLSVGSTYSISWLSWSDDIGKCANAGMYMRRASDGSYNFWDGQSNSQSTAFNTKARTWQRVYAVYTVSSGMDVNASWSCYMYGHYGNRGTVKIADVQIEVGYPSGFNRTSTRSNAQALLDLTGNNTITTSLAYASNGTFSFDGNSNNYIDGGNNTSVLNIANPTICVWVKRTSYNSSYPMIIRRNDRDAYSLQVGQSNDTIWFKIYQGGFWTSTATSYSGIPLNTWCHFAGVFTGSQLQLYKNGVLVQTTNTSSPISYNDASVPQLIIGRDDPSPGRYWHGDIPNVQIYNRALSAFEVQQNYNATKERYFGYQSLTYTYSGNISVANNGTDAVTVTKTTDNGNWNGQAYSTIAFTAPCTIEFSKAAEAGDNGNSYAMIGWNTDPTTDASYGSIDHAAYPYTMNWYNVYNNGNSIGVGGVWDSNKKFYIVYDTDGYIRHYNGSTLLYSANYGTGNTVYVDMSLYNTNTTYCKFSDIRVSRKSWNGIQYV